MLKIWNCFILLFTNSEFFVIVVVLFFFLSFSRRATPHFLCNSTSS